MERRELLKLIAVVTGSALIGGDVFLSGCKNPVKQGGPLLSASNIATLDEVADTIIPATDTPGAKATAIGTFMNTYATDCYRPDAQTALTEGLIALDDTCKKKFSKSFVELNAAQRQEILTALEAEAKAFNSSLDEKEKPVRDAARLQMKEFDPASKHYYTLIKQMTLFGYFTSEIGQKQALRFLPIPGKYDGAYPYKKGDKAWAIS